MTRGAPLALLCLTIFLVLFPLVVGKPGMPPNLKADEPAYYLMALSLAHDGDLRCESTDLRRLFAEFPYQQVRNLILMTDDGWRTIYFGKPYAYSLFAAPAAALAGANGIVAFNMALLMAMIWMGYSYLKRHNPEGIAALFAAGFFLLSTGFAYVFWIHPEVFNMTAVAATLFLAFRGEGSPVAGTAPGRRWWDRLIGPQTHAAWSGAVLTLAVYHKPVLGAFALPALLAFWRRGRWRDVLLWVAAFALALGVLAGVSLALTDHPIAYLGVQRSGVDISDPEVAPFAPIEVPQTADQARKNSWWWIFRLPDIDPGRLAASVGHFLVGRHTGLFVYMPFSAVALALFLLHGRRSPPRWMTIAALAAVAFFFLIWIDFNWHGGGGFVGNRYFVTAYPAFLFLVTTIRPAATALIAGFTAAGLFLGSLVMSPFGAPVPYPTLQQHVRGRAFDWLPFEWTIRRKVPGYAGTRLGGAWLFGRRDQYRPRDGFFQVLGGSRAVLQLSSNEPLESAVFLVRTPVPDNRIAVELGGDRQEASFVDARKRRDQVRRLDLQPRRPDSAHRENGKQVLVYHLTVEPEVGRTPTLPDGEWSDSYYLGAEVAYLGSAAELDDARQQQVSWQSCEAPAQVAAGSRFATRVRLRNDGNHRWRAHGVGAILLSHRWRDETGSIVDLESVRTHLPEDLGSGADLEVAVDVRAPREPGRHTLEIDLLREGVGWFSDRNGGATCETAVEVTLD